MTDNTDLKSKFKQGSLPSEQDYSSLIDSIPDLNSLKITQVSNAQAKPNIVSPYGDEIIRVTKLVDPTKFNFVVNTDNHWQQRSSYGRFKNAPSTQHLGIQHISNALALAQNVDALILGGDNNHPDYINIDVGKKDISITANKVLDTPTNSDRFMMLGNHDVGDSLILFNGLAKVKLNEIISESEIKKLYRTSTPLFGETRNKDSLYFYKDYPDKKIRLIGITTEDTQEVLDKDGYIKYPRLITHVLSQEQLNWIANIALMTTPKDYHVVMFGHAFLEEDTEIGAREQIINNGILGDMIDAWKKGTDFKATGNREDFKIDLQANFSTRGTGQFVGYFCGHEHSETSYDFHGFKVIKLLHSLTLSGVGKETRVAGTLSEDAESLVSIDTDKRTINIYGFGASHDRQFTY